MSETASQTPLACEELYRLLDIEEIDRDLYRGQNPWPTARRFLYGGHVAAQAVQAASRTVEPGRLPHSLHGYFLRPGQIDKPTILRVERDRDGGSFSSRHVVALQDGEVILSLTVSFHRPSDGLEWEADPAHAMSDPERLYPANPQGVFGEWAGVFDFRLAAPDSDMPVDYWTTPVPMPTSIWCRAKASPGDDPILSACLLTYVTDLSSGFGELGLPIVPPSGGPSLDHTVWIHRPIDTGSWFLLDLAPVIVTGGRGLYQGVVYDGRGRRCATISQEMLARSSQPSHPGPVK
ncbi:thioesterase family protein [Acidiferrimicrobium sp. IK]|uniref:acyl-CoA thioesterase n=1 Tax=Acidiferrimicrobium sp. IK TaxID=2871700 RepID=UPI0021CB1C83|nr:acyl-CoA thioesterase domain-containing protein [Acidiferrimicrobium sp. IK]MCU4186363.1 thioesterase family protein [Acidiferrimicrobium sp. IK]